MDAIFDCYLWYFPLLAFFEYILINKKRIFASKNGQLRAPYDEDNSYDYRAGFLFALIVFLPMLLIAGFRYRYFADTTSYVNTFTNFYPNSISELSTYLTGEERAPGFIIFGVLIKQIFGNNFRIYLLIIASISTLSLLSTYRKNTSEIVFVAFLFFSSSDMMSWMMNGMRQFLVASIFFAIVPLLLNKKFIPFLIISLILISFHTSALIAIPVFILALGKPMNKRTFLMMGGILLAIIFIDQFSDLLNDTLQNTNYQASASEITDRESDDGTNILRALFYSIPAILALFFRKKIPSDAPQIINYSVNMSLMTMAFYFLSVAMSGIYLGRIPIYFSLFNYILLPWEIKTFFDKDTRKIVFVIVIIVYIIFYLYQMYTWGLV